MAVDAPAAFGGFGDEDPGAFAERWVFGSGGDDFGQFFDDAELLVAVEDAGGGQDLDADVVAVTGDVGKGVIGEVVDCFALNVPVAA